MKHVSLTQNPCLTIGPSIIHFLFDEPDPTCRFHNRASWLCLGRLQKLRQVFFKMSAGSRHPQSQGGIFSRAVIRAGSSAWTANTD